MTDKPSPDRGRKDPQTPKATEDEAPPDDEPEAETVKFSPEEEAALVAESHTHKTEANALFNAGSYTQALTRYSDATAVCPTYLDFDLAVLQSNISACHLKLEEWKDAVASATAALNKLDKIDAQLAAEEKAAAAEKEKEAPAADDEVDEEIVSAGAGKSAPAPAPATGDDPEDPAAAARRKRREDALRIRYKALMRRARARSEEGGWSNLAGAEEDYKALAGMPNVTPGDRKIVAAQLRALPPRVKAAQERETAEMWGKLKELGNGILRPFGLSTENFKMEQDPKTGGYSMNFKQG